MWIRTKTDKFLSVDVISSETSVFPSEANYKSWLRFITADIAIKGLKYMKINLKWNEL